MQQMFQGLGNPTAPNQGEPMSDPFMQACNQMFAEFQNVSKEGASTPLGQKPMEDP